jgi:hypothetical protein
VETPEGLNLFRKFLVQNFAEEHLDFLVAVCFLQAGREGRGERGEGRGEGREERREGRGKEGKDHKAYTKSKKNRFRSLKLPMT